MIEIPNENSFELVLSEILKDIRVRCNFLAYATRFLFSHIEPRAL